MRGSLKRRNTIEEHEEMDNGCLEGSKEEIYTTCFCLIFLIDPMKSSQTYFGSILREVQQS